MRQAERRTGAPSKLVAEVSRGETLLNTEGCDGFIAKPIRYREFLATIAARLEPK
jgi:hypothetical protein